MTVEVISRENDTQTIDGDGRMVFDENQKVSIAMYATLSVVHTVRRFYESVTHYILYLIL